jgi:hypothetical protein
MSSSCQRLEKLLKRYRCNQRFQRIMIGIQRGAHRIGRVESKLGLERTCDSRDPVLQQPAANHLIYLVAVSLMTVGSRPLSARRRGTQFGQAGDRCSPGVHYMVPSLLREWMRGVRGDRVVTECQHRRCRSTYIYPVLQLAEAVATGQPAALLFMLSTGDTGLRETSYTAARPGRAWRPGRSLWR